MDDGSKAVSHDTSDWGIRAGTSSTFHEFNQLKINSWKQGRKEQKLDSNIYINKNAEVSYSLDRTFHNVSNTEFSLGKKKKKE